MSEITLSGRLPKGDANGLGPLARSLIQEPEKVHAILVLVDCTKIVTEVDTGETIPVARIRRAEAIRPSDIKEAQRLIRRAWEERNGDTVLPMELEDDIEAMFKGVDLSSASGLLEEPPQPNTAGDGDDEKGDNE